MKIGKIRLTHADKVIIAEAWILVIATILFVIGVINYIYGGGITEALLNDIVKPTTSIAVITRESNISVEIWLGFAFFILVKHWLEFYETHEDRRVHTMTAEELNKLDIQLKRMGDI